jgi:hypothetical protein
MGVALDARVGVAQQPAAPSVPSPAADTSAAPPPPVGECYGFSFGAWKPALDWRAAGHGADPAAVHLPGEFAARDSAGGGKELILFPSWWPAGVGVRFARAPSAVGDTVAGVASAFVADGRRPTPRAPVRAWRKACGAGARRP